MLISFSGLDGAGKSTQITILQQWVNDQGKSVVRLWARGGYTPGFLILKGLIRQIAGRRLPPAGRSALRQEQLSRPVVAKIWVNVAIFDLIWFWAVYLRWQILLGRVVISDRYIDDTRLDFRRNFPSVPFEHGFLWQLLIRVAPRPDCAFLFWIPVDEAMRRSRKKNEPFPDDEAALSWRLGCYLDESLFPDDCYTKLDGTSPVPVLAAEILAKVSALLPAK